MARRRVIHEEEEVKDKKDKKPAFTPSKFDETEFLQTENKSAKMIYITLAIAAIAGIGSFIIMRIAYRMEMDSFMLVPIIAPFAFIPLVLYVFKRFSIDLKDLTWKKYLENGFMYVLAWFAVWMISMNPPFSDFSNPNIEELVIVIETESGKQITYINTDSEIMMFVDDIEKTYDSISNLTDITRVEIYVPITDNWNLDVVDVVISEKRDNTYHKIEDLGSYNIFKGWNDSFDPDKNVTERIGKEWIQKERDVWEGHLYAIKFDLTDLDNKTYELDDGIQLRIEIKVEDSHSNTNELLYDLRISTGR